MDGGVIHLAEATALIVGVGGIGTGGAWRHRRDARAGIDARRPCPPGVVKLDGPDALDSLLPLAVSSSSPFRTRRPPSTSCIGRAFSS
jgi:hypothetical protein